MPINILEVQCIAGPAPCDQCPHFMRCRVRQIACASFVLYVNGYAERRWRKSERTPDRLTYLHLMRGHTPHLKKRTRRRIRWARIEVGSMTTCSVPMLSPS